MKTAMDIPDKEGQKRLVIVGGGFGGLKLARKLKSNKFQIVLLDKNNHHIFQLWGIERSGFFNGREKWAKGFENQRV